MGGFSTRLREATAAGVRRAGYRQFRESRITPRVTLLIALILQGCQSRMKSDDWIAGQTTSASQSVNELRDALRRFEADDSSGDADRVAAWYTDDAVWQPVRGTVVTGKAAIRQRYAKSFATDRITVRILEDAISVRGSLASVTGRTNVSVEPRAGGATQKLVDRFVMLMRKDANQWKVTALAWEPDSPAANSQPASNE